MKKAVIPYPPEASGEDVLQQQPQKVFPLQGAVACPAAIALDIAEGDLPIPAAQDVLLGNDAAIKVTRQVLQGRQAPPDMSAVDHPLTGCAGRDVQSRRVDRRQKTCAKDLGQVFGVKQILPFDLSPLSPAGIDTTAGHDDMQVRVIIKPPALGMQYRRHSHIRPQVPRVQPEILQGAGGAGKENGVDLFLKIPGQRPQFGGQSKGHHEVGNRQQLGLLPPQPLTGIVILAPRATAMAAGERAPFGLTTLRTVNTKLARLGCAAALDGVKRIQVAREQPVAVFGDQPIGKLLNDSGQVHRHLPDQCAKSPAGD